MTDMRKLIVCAVASLLAFGVSAQKKVAKPDFAYPKTVLKSADSLYNVSVKNGDAVGQLEALMWQSQAGLLIDGTTRQASVEKALSAAKAQKDSQMHALYDLYAAQLLGNYFQSDRWQFSRRQLPLTPRPADMSEWSGAMFTAVIDSLVSAAWKSAGDYPLADLARVVEADRLTLQYFPTLRDFAAACIGDMTGVSGALRDKIVAEAEALAAPDSPSRYYLQGQKLVRSAFPLKAVAEAFLKAKDKYNALVLWQFANGYPMSDDKTEKSNKIIAQALDEARKTAENSWAKPLVDNVAKNFYQPQFTLRASSYFPAGHPGKLKISGARNVDTLVIVANRYATYEGMLQARRARRGAPKAVSSEKFSYRLNGVGDTVLSLTLVQGYYLIKAENMDGDQSVIATPLQPVLSNTGKNRDITVFDAASGKPVPGVAVSLINSKNATTWSARTPQNGRLSVPADKKGHVRLSYNGKSMYFGDMYVSAVSKNVENRKSVDVDFTTDLAVVRPGDSIRWLAVANGNREMAKGLTFDVVMSNADGKNIDTVKVRTDEFGRAAGAFLVPADSKTGTFRLSVDAEKPLQVYGASWFKVADFKTLGVKINKLLAVPEPKEHKVTISGNVANYSGIGLSGSEVSMRVNAADTTITATALSGSDGKFAVTVGLPAKANWSYADVTATAPDGTTVQSGISFNARYAMTLNADCKNIVDAAKGLEYNAVVVSAAGDTVAVPLKWELKRDSKEILDGEVNSGKSRHITLPADIAPAYYMLRIAPADTSLCESQTLAVTIYRTDTAVLPDKERLMWNPTDSLIGISDPGLYVTAVYNTAEGGARYQSRELKGGYYDIHKIFDLSQAVYGECVTLFAVRDARYASVDLPVSRKPENLKIKLESFRDKVISGGNETWKFSVTDPTGREVRAAMALNVYDMRLDMFGTPERLRISPWRPAGPNLWIEICGGNNFSRYYRPLKLSEAVTVGSPEWLWITQGYGRIRNSVMFKSMASAAGVPENVKIRGSVYKEVAEESVADMAAPVPGLALGAVNEAADAEVAEDAGEAGATGKALEDVVLREDDKYSALWRPMLVTDARGMLSVPFAVPNSNTAWQMTATAWTADGTNGSVSRTFTSGKPVTVSLNAPQFVRGGDVVTVMASVVNATDAEREVTVRLESTATASMPVVDERRITLAANGNTTVPVSVSVPALADSITFVVRAISGDNSDGEMVRLAVLPSQSRVTETQNFYLNPGQTEWSAELPAAKGKDYEAELTFTGNPMWTIVQALPEVTGKGVNATAGSQARLYFGAAVTLSLMKQHPELELKYNRQKLQSLMNGARSVLKSLQRPDGGWMWGEWSTASSAYVTGEVLDAMATLKRAGMLDDAEMERMIQRALPYWDNNVEGIDLFYTIVRSAFGTPQQSLNGRKVTNATVQDINKNWKKYDIGRKTLAACALWYTGNTNMAKTLLGSLDQFGTQTRNKGFEFKNVRSLQTYAWLLEAYGAIAPKSAAVDGLRQYLIVRKQGEAWGNSIITTDIVAAMINSGTPWTVKAGAVTLNVDGMTSVPEQTDRMGQFTVPVKGNSVSLTRGEATTPAYGALVTRYTAPSAKIEAYSDGEISITKKLMVQNADGTWRNFNPEADSLKVGQTVKTLLTVKADRPMSNVVVTDDRAATLIPVNQLSGWVYGDGIFAYRENRAAATNLYLDYVAKGTWLLEYSFRVNNAGSFNTGVATATCSQAPTLTAHSSGCVLNVKR